MNIKSSPSSQICGGGGRRWVIKNKNSKVPVAILSCFLIAFILQGVLKLCGVLVFEKALNWDIFNIIDKYKSLQIIYYSIFSFIVIYCLSFSMTAKPYSNKWWHYLIILITSIGLILIREYVAISMQINIVLDVIAYSIVPSIINITMNRRDRLFDNNTFGVISTLTIHILLYFCYLGLGYWSNMLNSILPVNSLWHSSSRFFLIKLEVYVGLVAFMLTTNETIKYTRRYNNMDMPVDIATKKAKLEAKKARTDKKKARLDKKSLALGEKSLALAKQIEEFDKKDAEQVKENTK